MCKEVNPQPPSQMVHKLLTIELLQGCSKQALPSWHAAKLKTTLLLTVKQSHETRPPPRFRDLCQVSPAFCSLTILRTSGDLLPPTARLSAGAPAAGLFCCKGDLTGEKEEPNKPNFK